MAVEVLLFVYVGCLPVACTLGEQCACMWGSSVPVCGGAVCQYVGEQCACMYMYVAWGSNVPI